MTPGAKFSVTTLLDAIRRSASARPLGERMLIVTPSLLRL
jgi:hypothetical protein